MSTRRRITYALSLFAGFIASACAAFYPPTEEDDGVQRCNTSEDCDPIGDNRYVAQCVYGEGQPENSPKVCVADFETKIGCGGTAYGDGHPLTEAYEDAVDNKANYGQCSEENRGKRGCAPMDGGACNEGLEINNASGVCDDPDDPIPAIYPPDVGGPNIAGQDAKDQFCRWYFCDESFVCVQSSAGELCRPCSGTDPEDFGSGGCGTLYIEGEPSPIYTPNLDDANCNGQSDDPEAMLGSWPDP